MAAREGAVNAKRAGLCQLRDLLVTTPEPLRSELRPLTRAQLLHRLAAVRPTRHRDVELRGALQALRTVARRIQHLTAEERELAREIETLTQTLAPQLLDQPGVGPLAAAQLVISWSHPGRIRSEAAFARLAGCAPIPASSGQTIRYRLDRSGDRQLNRALHMILVTRRRTHPPTIAYIDRRIRDGKAAAKQTAASSATSPAAFTDCSSIRHRRLDSYRSITGPLHSGRVRSALGNAGRCAGTVQVSHGRRWPKALSSHRRTHSVGRYGDTSLGNGHSRTRHRHHCRFRSAPRRPAATVARTP